MIGQAFKGLGSLVGGVAKGAGGVAKGVGKAGSGVGLDFSSPGMALGVGLPTALIAGDLAGQVGSSVKAEFTGLNKELDKELRRRRAEAAQGMRARRLQRAIAENMSRLAAANPQLYNQLLVGRLLPQGAVVIGGGQRPEFLESVAYQMATGGFESSQSSPDAADAIRNLVGSY